MKTDEIIINAGGVELCAQSFGNPDDTAIILIMGASASMVWWDAEFCERLGAGRRFVIRFDNRDTGQSASYEPGRPDYSVTDMVDDIIRVMDHFKIKRGHLAGMSLGGMLAQLAALRNPERVLTITLIASSVWDDRPDLPPIDKKILDYHSSAENLDWADEQAVIRYMAEGWRLLNGTKHPFEEKRAYKMAGQELKRARNLLSMFNHALLKGGESYYGQTDKIKAPALIIHGTEDPVLPYPHALALEKSIPGAELVSLEGVGHEIPYPEWPVIIKAIIDHTR